MVFKHPVQVLFMTPKAFDKTVTTSSDRSAPRTSRTSRTRRPLMRALGLIDGKVDLFKEENGLNQNGILAYYDFHDKKVRVKGTALTPDVRVTLAHELTHALQDQYFDLGRQDTLPDDSAQAYRSVIEGDAVVVQNAYADTMSQADQDAYNKAESQGSRPGLLERARHPGGPGLRALHRRTGLRARRSRPGAATRAIDRGAAQPAGQHRGPDEHLQLPEPDLEHARPRCRRCPLPAGAKRADDGGQHLRGPAVVPDAGPAPQRARGAQGGRRLAQRHQHRVPRRRRAWCASTPSTRGRSAAATANMAALLEPVEGRGPEPEHDGRRARPHASSCTPATRART